MNPLLQDAKEESAYMGRCLTRVERLIKLVLKLHSCHTASQIADIEEQIDAVIKEGKDDRTKTRT